MDQQETYPWEAPLAAVDLDIAERAERIVVEAQGSLTRTTTEAKWRRYWTSVADIATMLQEQRAAAR